MNCQDDEDRIETLTEIEGEILDEIRLDLLDTFENRMPDEHVADAHAPMDEERALPPEWRGSNGEPPEDDPPPDVMVDRVRGGVFVREAGSSRGWIQYLGPADVEKIDPAQG